MSPTTLQSARRILLVRRASFRTLRRALDVTPAELLEVLHTLGARRVTERGRVLGRRLAPSGRLVGPVVVVDPDRWEMLERILARLGDSGGDMALAAGNQTGLGVA